MTTKPKKKTPPKKSTSKPKTVKKAAKAAKVASAAPKPLKVAIQQKAAESQPAAQPSALSTLPPAAVEVQSSIRSMHAQVLTLKVEDPETLNTANTMLSQLKSMTTKWEDHRKSITRPMDEAKKRILALFKPADEQLEAMTRELKTKVIEYHREAEAKQAAERRKLVEQAEQQAAAGDTEAAAASALAAVDVSTPALRTAVNDVGSTQLKSVWTFEVTDVSLVPREYLVVDEKRIRAAVSSGVRDHLADGVEATAKDAERAAFGIPGVRIFQTTQLAVSGGWQG